MSVPVGNPLNFTVVFTDSTGETVDPAAVSIKVEAPDSTTTTYTYPTNIVKLSAGEYQATIQVTQQGRYYAIGYGTLDSGFIVTSPDAFEDVVPSRVA